jgi:hypothetical protein
LAFLAIFPKQFKINDIAGFVGDSAKDLRIRCDETFDRFWLVNIKYDV